MISYWGVDHGEEIGKNNNEAVNRHLSGAGATTLLAGPAGAGLHAGVTGKKGSKGRATATALGNSVGGAALGAGIGRIGGGTGMRLGTAVGTVAGGSRGALQNIKQGRVKGIK